jgi:hypothetical protein
MVSTLETKTNMSRVSRRSTEQQHGRLSTLPYAGLVSGLAEGRGDEFKGEWQKKYDGFSGEINVHSNQSGLTYSCKSGNPWTEASMDPGKPVDPLKPVKCLGNHRVFRAMDWYMREKASYLDPRGVVLNGRRGRTLKIEFCVYRKDCPKEYDDLSALMFAQCVTEDDKIDLENYGVEVIVYDVVFESYPEKADPPYHARLESIKEVFNGFPGDPATTEYRNHVPWRLFGHSDVLEIFTEHEGVAVCMGRAPFEHWVKIKPDRPVGLVIVGALDTVGTNGYDKILLAATDGEGRYKAVDMIDLETIFTDYERVKQGKAYVNPASIRKDPISGGVDCTSSSSLRPMLSALFGRISIHGGQLKSPSVASSSEIRVHDYTVACGKKRSFHRWFGKMLFLEYPQRVTMSANGFWLVPNDPTEVHLQASRVLSVGNYGAEHFQNLTPVSHATLHHIATNRLERNPTELYRLSGVRAVPFADLPKMGDGLFLPP